MTETSGREDDLWNSFRGGWPLSRVPSPWKSRDPHRSKAPGSRRHIKGPRRVPLGQHKLSLGPRQKWYRPIRISSARGCRRCAQPYSGSAFPVGAAWLVESDLLHSASAMTPGGPPSMHTEFTRRVPCLRHGKGPCPEDQRESISRAIAQTITWLEFSLRQAKRCYSFLNYTRRDRRVSEAYGNFQRIS